MSAVSTETGAASHHGTGPGLSTGCNTQEAITNTISTKVAHQDELDALKPMPLMEMLSMHSGRLNLLEPLPPPAGTKKEKTSRCQSMYMEMLTEHSGREWGYEAGKLRLSEGPTSAEDKSQAKTQDVDGKKELHQAKAEPVTNAPKK